MAATATIKTRSIQSESLSASTDSLINMILEEGVFGKAANSYKVAQDTGSNMQVKVGSATAFDRAAVRVDFSPNPVVICRHENATQTLTIPAAHGTLARKDIVILRVYDNALDSSGNSYSDLEVIQGTAAGSPSEPALPSSAIKLAVVDVPAADTAITNSQITDSRSEVAVAGLLRASTDTDDVRAGAIGFDDTNDELEVGLGAAVASIGLGAWRTYSPTYVNVTVGNGTVVARYVRSGKFVAVHWELVLGSTSAIGTDPQVSVPVTAAAQGVEPAIGLVSIRDVGVGTYEGTVRFITTTVVVLHVTNTAGTYALRAQITATAPMTFVTGDSIRFIAFYEAA